MYLSEKNEHMKKQKKKIKFIRQVTPHCIATTSAAATTTATTTTSTAATTTATTTTYESTSLGRVFYNPLSTHCWIKRLQ